MGWVTAGITLQVLGAVVTWSGLRKTFHTYKIAGEKFLLWPHWPSLWQAPSRTIRRMAARLRLKTAQIEAKLSGDVATATESAYVIKRTGMPSGLSQSEQTKWLAEKLLELSARVDAESQAVKNERHRLRQTTDRYADELREMARQAAYGGVRRQTWGLVLITIGVLVAAIPAYGQAEPPSCRTVVETLMGPGVPPGDLADSKCASASPMRNCQDLWMRSGCLLAGEGT